MPQDHRAVGGRTLEGFPDPPPRFCTVCETVSAVHGRVHPPHHLSPVQVPPGVPGHAGGLSRCASVGYCYPTASQRDAPPRDGDPPRCGRAWPGTVHPVCTRRLPVAHADRRAGECNGADEQCSGDALRASGRGGCSRVPSVPPVWVRPGQVPAPGTRACPPRGGHAGGAGGCGGEAGRAG